MNLKMVPIGIVAFMLIFAAVGFGTFVHAQTTTVNTSSTIGVTATTTPGIPNTGAGGDAPFNAVALIASGLVMAAGVGYLIRTRTARA